MKFSDPYTNPLVSWVYKCKRSSVLNEIYNYTGMNFRSFKFASDIWFLMGLLYFGGMVVMAYQLKDKHLFGIPGIVLITLPAVLIRIFTPTTPYREYDDPSYITIIQKNEKQQFGQQVTPTWLIVFWYGILRMDRWSLKYVLGIITEFCLIGLVYLIYSHVKGAFILSLPFVISTYLYCVYHIELRRLF